ncbi:MAG: AAA family ATPase [Oscillospiraceae bacterium]
MNLSLNEEQLLVLKFSNEILNEVKKVIIGKDEIILKILLAILSGGHVLIEDIPGVGKTTLALALSKALSLDYKRMQFTPDVLPTDVTGFNIYNKENNRFEFKKGAAFTNLFLADEINRTSSKTQSALLEVMEEGKVTVDGVTYKMPEPYVVIATQNPVGSVGTQLLPESQMDRFMIRLSMGYPELENEVEMLRSKQNFTTLESVNAIVSAGDIIKARKIVEQIFVSDSILTYVAMLAKETRNNQYIKLGLSPRGSIALLRMSKAAALLQGRDYVIPDDVIYCFNDVVQHRLVFSSKAKINGTTGKDILNQIISQVPVPNITHERG